MAKGGIKSEHCVENISNNIYIMITELGMWFLLVFFKIMRIDIIASSKSQYKATHDPIFIIGGIVSWVILIYIVWNYVR